MEMSIFSRKSNNIVSDFSFDSTRKLYNHSKKYETFPVVFGWKFKGNGQFSLGN